MGCRCKDIAHLCSILGLLHSCVLGTNLVMLCALSLDACLPGVMYYDVTVLESPDYEVAVKYNIFCGVMLAGNTLYVIVVRYKRMLLFAKRFTVTDLPP